MRGRMMVDRGIAEQVYLPWLSSIANGQFSPGAMLREKQKFEPYFAVMDFEKEAFAVGAGRSREAMEEARAGSVGIIPVIGEFLKYGTDCSYGANEIVPAFYEAADNSNIIAVVLEMDSGGGAESAVPPFIEAIKYIQSKGKPVVVHGDMVASAAYYIASFADYIMMDNLISSAFGSIGVYVSYMDYREKLQKDGIKAEVVYAPQSDLKNHEYRQIMENDPPNKQPLIDNILVPSADRFIQTVKQNRGGKIKEDSEAFRGKLFEGKEILREGLADGMGSLAQAVKIAGSMALIKKNK
jgi:protease-4